MRNLRLATIALALAGFCLAAYAAYETISLPAGKPVDVPYPARLAYFQVPRADATLERIDYAGSTTSFSVTTTYATNYTYSITYTNDLGVTTNTVDYSLEPLPPGLVYADYWTNTIVTVTKTTNTVTTAFLATNTVGSVSQVGDGIYGITATNVYLPAGTKLVNSSGTGTAILEK